MATSFACYNIRYGIGIDGVYDSERIAATVGRADIVALQEVTRGFPGNSGVDMVGELCRWMPGHFTAVGVATDIDSGSVVEDGVAVNRRFQFGNMILSRFPIISIRNHLLPRRRRQGKLNLQRGALETVIAAPGAPLRVICVHLDHIDESERFEQIASLRNIITDYDRHGGAITGMREFGYEEIPVAEGTIILGDFNMRPDSAEYTRMADAGGLDLVDISAADPGHSFFDPDEAEPRQRLDYVFADAGTAARISGFRIDRQVTASDHLPLWFELD